MKKTQSDILEFGRMKKSATLFSLFVFIFSFALSAQKNKKDDAASEEKKKAQLEEKLLNDAEYFFLEENYLRALPLYKQLAEKYPNYAYYRLQTGTCYIYKTDEKEKAIEELKAAESLDAHLENLYFFLGRALHINYRFDDAIDYFNMFLQKNPAPEMKVAANRYIDNCNNAKILFKEPLRVDIQNIGGVVNTNNSEYVPVVSSDESVLIFTYRGERSTGGLQTLQFKPDPDGEYYEDIFITYKVGDKFQSPDPIGNKINTNKHDASIALSSDGQKLFVYRSINKDKGDIYMSSLTGEDWSEPKRLNKNINTKYWEGSCSMSSDEQLLYFASEKPGGFGGRDIYVSKKDDVGEWGPAVNIGPNINTPFNDDAPFILSDGVTLFFSSEGHSSIGGYDIMYSSIKDDIWSTPTNMGYPLNTPEDERYYVLTADGEKGYYSSDRKGTYGQQDIYMVTPGFTGQKPVLALVLGFVTADDKPAGASINVSNTETGEKTGSYESNSATGKYIIALTPGNNYKIAFEVEGRESLVQYVNVKELETFVEVKQDIKMYSKEYVAKNNITVSDSSHTLNNKITEQLEKYKSESGPEVCEEKVYKKILKNKGDMVKDSVTYRVELGRYENYADFNGKKVSSLGTIVDSKAPDGDAIYYFANEFNTLLDAEIFKYKVLKEDSTFNSTIEVSVNDRGNLQRIRKYYDYEYVASGCKTETLSKRVRARTSVVNPSLTASTQKAIKSLDTDEEYDNIVKAKGTAIIEGISYKVEIASVTDTNDFNLQSLEKYGKIERKLYPDGTYRYSFGVFGTLKEGEDFKRMLVEKEPKAEKSFVTVFYFGKRKTVKEQFGEQPCDEGSTLNFSEFAGKDLNNKEVYNKLINFAGNYCFDGMTFTVQIGAYRFPKNFKYPYLNDLMPPPADVKDYPDGITRFTLREFKTLKEAEAFRQKSIKRGQKDAWITAWVDGKRELLSDLINVNFHNLNVN